MNPCLPELRPAGSEARAQDPVGGALRHPERCDAPTIYRHTGSGHGRHGSGALAVQRKAQSLDVLCGRTNHGSCAVRCCESLQRAAVFSYFVELADKRAGAGDAASPAAATSAAAPATGGAVAWAPTAPTAATAALTGAGTGGGSGAAGTGGTVGGAAAARGQAPPQALDLRARAQPARRRFLHCAIA